MSFVLGNSTRNLPPARGSSSASFPFQRTYWTGSVRSRKTVSGDASIVITRSMTFVSTAMLAPPLLLFAFSRGFQGAQALRPVRLERSPELSDRLGPRAVQALRSVPPLGHQTGLPQDAQVLGHRRPGDVEAARDLADGELSARDEPQNLSPARLAERRKCVHFFSVSVTLRTCKRLATDLRLNHDR